MTVMERIQDFMAQKRIAVAGVSRQEKDFSRALFREMRAHGYDMVAVNPEAREIEGSACFARMQDVAPTVDGVLLMTPAPLTDSVVHDCAEAGVTRVWMYRAGGRGAVSAEAVRFCEANGISVIPGECPLMFLTNGHWFHRVHGLVKKITGSYPK